MIRACSVPLLTVPYQSEGFPLNTVKLGNTKRDISVTWDALLWSAMTVGRPKRYYVIRHGESSIYELMFRYSLIKMALENGPSLILRRTDTAKSLDPTEKGMVNYFVGMTFCKLFSSALLDAPWLLHLDVWRPRLDIKLSGRSRPDLVGHNSRTDQWYGFECKGRANRPGRSEITKAKDQARRIVCVDRKVCSLRVAAITYYVDDMVHFYWCDPPRENAEDPINLPLTNDVWQNYYGIVADLIANSERDESGHMMATIEQCDIELGVHESVAGPLLERDWGRARSAALEAAEDLASDGFHADGVRVHAGDSWYEVEGEDATSARGSNSAADGER